MIRPDMTHDPEADAVYIKLAEDAQPYEAEEVSPGVVLDFTQDGLLVGIEIMPASKVLAPGDWSRARLPGPLPSVAAE